MVRSEFTFDRRPGHSTIPANKIWSLEASAGTGKTWTIEQLATHYLASPDLQPHELVVVTFTRAAAAELRSRIRNTVARAAQPSEPVDPALTYSPEEQKKLQKVLGDIGQLRVTTIHRFAQQSLAMLGAPIGELSSEAQTDHFRTAAINDVLRSFNTEKLTQFQSEEKSITTTVLNALKVLSNNPGGHLIASQPTDSTKSLIELVELVQANIELKKRKLGIASYDDLMVRLDEYLKVESNLDKVASSIKVLMIDEFQDTDGLQWEIFSRIAGSEHVQTFVTVGDPKQAIYGFRGGDVQVYREAVGGDALTLQSNYRSSQQLLDANNAFFAGQGFGSEGVSSIAGAYEVPAVSIDYQEVVAAGAFANHPMTPSWEFRMVEKSQADEIRREIVHDVATYIDNVVHRDVLPTKSSNNGPVDGTRLVTYSDICILVTANAFGRQLTKGLQQRGIPATMLGGANVFTSEAAQQWSYLLGALSDPSNPSSARLLAFSWFGGESHGEIAKHREDEIWLSKLTEKLTHWSAEFLNNRRTFFDDLMRESGIREFLVAREGAERNLTDLDHVAEILASRANDDLELLSSFLREANLDDDGESSENPDFLGTEWSRRIDRDTSAVKIMTIHRSKGLEFPIVLVPYLAETGPGGDRVKGYRARADDSPVTLVDVTVAGNKNKLLGPKVKGILNKAETRRKGYVALTRAQFRNVVWTWQSKQNVPLFHDDEKRRKLAADFPELFAYTEKPVGLGRLRPPAIGGIEPPILSRAHFTCRLLAPSERHSFTSISDRLLGARETADAISDDRVLELNTVDVEPESSEGDFSGEGDFVDVKSSKWIGIAVHSVLQHITLEGHDADARRITIAEHLQNASTSSALQLSDHETEQLVELIDRSLRSSLGAIGDHQLLQDFTQANLLPELGFDFPISPTLSDGERLQQRVEQLLQLLRKHLSDDPVCQTWLKTLSARDMDLAGMVTGSIDAVLGWKSEHGLRFLVVDYKTNRRVNTQGVETYVQPQLIEAMSEHHYQLQALIYVVALHRYLRSRIQNYDYDVHVAGAAYLFLRGMQPSSPGSGVIAFTPPKALIEEMSAFFDGRFSD